MLRQHYRKTSWNPLVYTASGIGNRESYFHGLTPSTTEWAKTYRHTSSTC